MSIARMLKMASLARTDRALFPMYKLKVTEYSETNRMFSGQNDKRELNVTPNSFEVTSRESLLFRLKWYGNIFHVVSRPMRPILEPTLS